MEAINGYMVYFLTNEIADVASYNHVNGENRLKIIKKCNNEN